MWTTWIEITELSLLTLSNAKDRHTYRCWGDWGEWKKGDSVKFEISNPSCSVFKPMAVPGRTQMKLNDDHVMYHVRTVPSSVAVRYLVFGYWQTLNINNKHVPLQLSFRCWSSRAQANYAIFTIYIIPIHLWRDLQSEAARAVILV